MPFPVTEMKLGGTHALIFNEAGQIIPVKVNILNGLLFYVKNYGVHQLNKKYGLGFGKGRVYFYDQMFMNPIDIGAFMKACGYLDRNHLASFSRRQMAMLVDNVLPEATADQVAKGFSELGLKLGENTEKVLKEHALGAAMEDREALKKELGEDVVDFFNDYYHIDITAQKSIRLKILEDSDFKLKGSPKMTEWWPFQKAFWTSHIALVVIDNRRLDAVPCKTETRIVDGKPITYVMTKEYGDFEIEGNRNIYRYKRTLVYVLAVNSSEELA